MVTIMASATALQPPLPVVVKIKFTVPAAVSAALKVYVAFKVFGSGVNVPLPELIHVPPVEIVTDPFKETLPIFAHMVVSLPASAVGRGVIVIIIVSITAKQEPLAVEVSVNVTVANAMSAGLGVYVPFNANESGVNVPVPLVVHWPVIVPPETEPLRVTSGLFAHTAWLTPAVT